MYNTYRVAAVMPLHYGADFLADAIRSVADIVDEYRFMYSARPCHGVLSTDIPNPDSRSDLFKIAMSAAAGKGIWHDGIKFNSEGHQVVTGAQFATTCPIYLKLDSDELWDPGLLRDAIDYGLRNQRRELRIPLRHYWRSLKKAICHDPAAPGRVYFKYEHFGWTEEDTFNTPDDSFRIHHMGYALPSELVRYKMSIHGHSHQFRRDCDWFTDVFMKNRQVDCHPVGSDEWNAEDVPVPDMLKNHPFAKLRLIP